MTSAMPPAGVIPPVDTTNEDEQDLPKTKPGFWDESIEFKDGPGPGKMHPVHLGDVLDDSRYKPIQRLGAGAFSTVWLARDRKTNRYVALKITRADLSEIENETKITEFLSR